MKGSLNRRQFIQTSAAIGAGLYVSGKALGADAAKKDVINVALLGVGAQGQALMGAITKMGHPDQSGVRIMAVCDIWEKWNLRRVSRQLKTYKTRWGYGDSAYTDYKEMLDTEKDLDAVIVATPDFWHAEHSIACMEKGLHVYCEKEMSNTIEGARKMVEAQKKTGKLLQIGHQRRSNPRYIHCYDNLISEAGLLGRVTGINGQWNRSKESCRDLVCPEGAEIEQAVLDKFGFKDMKQFMNWRWYKGLGGGPIVDLGSHQIDIYSWFLGANPKSIMASGGIDYWKGHEWYDNVMAVYEYDTPKGPVRAFYQTGTTNSANGYFECFMGDEGTLVISEASSRGSVYREGWVEEAKWDQWVSKGYIEKSKGKPVAEKKDDAVLDVRESVPAAEYHIPVTFTDPYHMPHLKNFFNSIRGTEKLNCPAEVGFETAVTVLKVNEAVEKATRLEFKPEEFKA